MIDKSILEAVEAALPSLQVKVLRDALNNYEQLQREYAESEAELERLAHNRADDKAAISRLNGQVNELRESSKALAERAKSAEDALRQAEATSLRAELAAVHAVTDKFLKNTIYRESLQHTVVTENPNVQFQPGQYGSSPVQVGTYQTAVPVTDVKETSSE